MLVKAKKTHSFNDFDITLIGISHKNSKLEQREKLHFDKENQLLILEQLKKITGVRECAIICTCNRTELVLVSQNQDISQKARKILISSSGLSQIPEFYAYKDSDAIKHFFKVNCGIDSLIPGEQQIAAQQKESYSLARENNFTDFILNRLYQTAFSVSKSVRSSTAIGKKAVSVSYAAKELSEQIFGDLGNVSVMLIGAGRTGELAAKHLYASGVRKFTIVNRTYENAIELAKSIGARVLSFDEYLRFIPEADIVIGAVSCEQPYLIKGEVQDLIKSRTVVSQFFIDLGVPRNFDSSISTLSDVFLYTVDDLENVVKENINSRTMEFTRAEMIIDQQVLNFFTWFSNLNLTEDIKDLVSHFNNIAKIESNKTLKRLIKAGYAPSPELREAIEVLSNSLVSKIIDSPIKKIREKEKH